jgi:hypothetical protein
MDEQVLSFYCDRIYLLSREVSFDEYENTNRMADAENV